MKTITRYIASVFFLLLAYSCVDDKGNYSYLDPSEIMPIQIEGIEEEMTVQIYNKLQITPELKNMDNPEKYTYEWYVMEYVVAGKAPERRDISNEQNLNYEVNLDPGLWRLIYKVTDKQNNVYTRAEVKLNVIASPVDTQGWYILKDDGNETDFDFINAEGTYYKDVLREQGLQLPGTAVSMEFQDQRYYHNIIDEHGNVVTLVNQSAFHILSSQETYTINSKTIQLFKDFEEQFYQTPETCKPQSMKHNGSGFRFFVNDGRVYKVNGMSANVGKVSPVAGLYNLYGNIITCGYKECLVFDLVSHSFKLADAYVDELLPLPELEQNDAVYSFENMHYSLVCMDGGPYGTQGYAVMKDNESEGGILLRTNNRTLGFTSLSPIDGNSKLLTTDLLAMPNVADFLYFKHGNNKVYSYENAKDIAPADKEKEILTYPEGELITSMKYVFRKATDEKPGINQLAVLTTSAGNWKLYLYDLLGESTPEINSEPAKVYEGEGNGRFLLYRNN